ncbi:MAG: nucleotidyltransferase domain-containing protein [Ignavibacteriaceae bacterium]|nr:nucleotidyltransferase domain-containing protein [Ignavibacteriaceae bacterium]
MIFNKTLNFILSSGSQISVLRVLQYHKTGITGREVARLSGLSPKTALQSLSQLEELKVVKRVIGGRDHHFTLNRDNYLIKNGVIPLLKAENDYLPQLFVLLKKKLSQYCISIILFGSVARKEESITSDLDICIILQDKKSIKIVTPIVHELQKQIFTEYGATLSPLYFTVENFCKMAVQKLPPVDNIIKEGILIYGKPIRTIINGSQIRQSQN